jgi:SAM-dependent methyltransferase
MSARVSAGRPGQAAGGLSFAVAALASAALVFLLEPLMGKLLLPTLGGAPAIWNTLLAFFQAALLAGYAWAHVLQRAGPVRRQARIHLIALAAAVLVLPLRLSDMFGPPWPDAPALWLAAVLLVSIGPPFALLSASAPLLQAWFAAIERGRSEGPMSAAADGRVYRLYVASNLGSLLALAAYPTLVEPLFGLRVQAIGWSVGYVVFALALAALVLTIRDAPTPRAPEAAPPTPAPTWLERLTWMLLAAAPASLLSGVTAHITADVASAPFLWIPPLGLYLITFIIAFARKRAAPPVLLYWMQLVLAGVAIFILAEPRTPWLHQLAIQLAAFFVAALACHATLAARRPQTGRLTDFYLWMAVGGVVGGGFNAFLAPLLFDRVWEYPAVLVLAVLARPDAGGPLKIHERGWLVAGMLCLAPALVPKLMAPEITRTVLSIVPAFMAVMLARRPAVSAALLGAMVLAVMLPGAGTHDEFHRSFFGVVRLTDTKTPVGPVRIMVHGTTLHGAQVLTPKLKCLATAYYAPEGVIGQAVFIEQARHPSMRFAVVGLGAGTTATFTRPTDKMRYFEIDPMMGAIAFDPRKFSFVKGCAQGPVDVVLGDARLSLATEKPGAYDFILVDAFNSDSVPTHLLTVEAMRLYLRLLAPDGVIVLHLSNRNLDLAGPAAAAARAAGAGGVLYGEHWTTRALPSYLETGGMALVVAKKARTLDPYRVHANWRRPIPSGWRPWTDDYTNVWGALIAGLKRPD